VTGLSRYRVIPLADPDCQANAHCSHAKDHEPHQQLTLATMLVASTLSTPLQVFNVHFLKAQNDSMPDGIITPPKKISLISTIRQEVDHGLVR
jgi:hypothetical protein